MKHFRSGWLWLGLLIPVVAIAANTVESTRGIKVDTTTATDDQLILSVTPGGAARFAGTITATDLTANRTYTVPDATGTVTLGTGTNTFVPLWSATNTLTNSVITQVSSQVGINVASPLYKLTTHSTDAFAAALIQGDDQGPAVGTLSTLASHYALEVVKGSSETGSGAIDVMCVMADGKVGINIPACSSTPPGNFLTVLTDGTAGTPALSLGATADPDTGLFHSAANTLNVSTGGTQRVQFDVNGLTATRYNTATDCVDSAGAAACGSAAAGSVVIDDGATTVVVTTTAMTAASEPFPMFDSSLGTKLSVTCNTTFVNLYVTARTGTSFTVTASADPAGANPVCLSYFLTN